MFCSGQVRATVDFPLRVLYNATQVEAQRRRFIQREFGGAIRQHRFAAIVLDVDDWWLSPGFEQYYIKRGAVFDDPNVFFPVTGVQTRPESIYTTPK